MEKMPASAEEIGLVEAPEPSLKGSSPAPKQTLVNPYSDRNFFDNRFVYAVISQRARGLSIGIDLNPGKKCNFDCVYCEVDRSIPARDNEVDVDVMSTELEQLMGFVVQDRLRELACYRNAPAELLKLKEVALSGNGEPTLCPNFAEVVHGVIHVRAQGTYPFFKIVLLTNATGLHLPEVQDGLRWFTPQDEIWVKLDIGTQEYMEVMNRPLHDHSPITLSQVLANILMLGRQRPIVIQSLFPLLDGKEPPPEEIEQYTQRLKELKTNGASISLIQVYSAHRPATNSNVGHLPLKSLSRIAQRVREVTGLKAEVF